MSAPVRTGKPLHAISLTNYLMPVQKNGQPMFLRVSDSDKLYIPVFETRDKLAALWRAAPQLPPYDRVKRIDNGREFITSIRENNVPNLVVIADPHMLENQRVRFTQIFLDGDEIPSSNPN